MPQSKEDKLPDQISANGRTVLRKHFSESTPIVLPRGHCTIAFSEPLIHIHAVLKTISDETVKSSLHVMRSLVLQAVYSGRGQTLGQFSKALLRGGVPTSSGGEYMKAMVTRLTVTPVKP